MNKILLTTFILVCLTSCTHYSQGHRTPSSIIDSRSCGELIGPFVEEEKRRVVTDFFLGQNAEPLSDEQINQLRSVIEDIDDSIIRNSKKLEAPEKLEALTHLEGKDPYFNMSSPNGQISIPYQYSENFFSYEPSPWNKAHRFLTEKLRQSTGNLDNLLKMNRLQNWTESFLGEPSRGLMKVYKKHPKYSRNIFAHEFGHSIFNTNLKKFSPELVEYNKLSTELGKANNRYFSLYNNLQKAKNEVLLELIEKDEKYKKLSFFELDSLEELATDPRVITANKELEENNTLINNIINELGTSAFGKFFRSPEGDEIFMSYNEMFADVTALIYSGADPKAISSPLAMTRKIQEIKKYGASNVSISSRDFSNKSNRIDKWVENKASSSIHNSMAPVRFFLYDRYFHMPYYQSGQGAAELYETILQVIASELRYLINNPEFVFDIDEKYTKRQINQHFIESIIEATRGWR